MSREQVIEIFNDLICGNRDKITYSKGYAIFDEIYEAFENFGLIKKNKGIYKIVTR